MRRFGIPTLVLFIFAGSAALAQQSVPGAVALDRWDANSDNRVTLAEVQAGRTRLFASYDSNGDGALSVSELGRYSAQGSGSRSNRGTLRYTIDSNGDGFVSKSEFVGGSTQWMDRMDQNGDGVLTSTDFGRNARGAGRGNGQGRGARWNNG